MRGSGNRKEKSRDLTGFSAPFARADRQRRGDERANGGSVAACVALLRHGIAKIAAVRSSPRLGREEEKEW